MFRLSVISDEVSQDPLVVARFCREFGMQGVEPRSVWDKPPQELTDDDAKRLRDLFAEEGVAVCAIASPFFKCDYGNADQRAQHLAILRRCIALGRLLGTDLIRGFVFWQTGRTEEIWPDLVGEYAEPVRILEGEDAYIGIENEASTSIASAALLRRFLDDLGSPRVRAIWDPGNEAYYKDGEAPYPDGYNRVKDLIIHVHIKDCTREGTPGGGESVPIGEGLVDWPGQLGALLDDRYEGYASLETHWRPKHVLSEAAVVRPGGSAFSEAGEEASRICMQNLLRFLEEAKAQRGL